LPLRRNKIETPPEPHLRQFKFRPLAIIAIQFEEQVPHGRVAALMAGKMFRQQRHGAFRIAKVHEHSSFFGDLIYRRHQEIIFLAT